MQNQCLYESTKALPRLCRSFHLKMTGTSQVLVPSKSDAIFVLNWILRTILVAFSTKTSKACTGMLSSENDDFKFLKTAKNGIGKSC